MKLKLIPKNTNLKMCIRKHRCTSPKVLDLREARHQFRPGHTTALINKLYGRPFTIMRHTIPDQHVKFGIIVLDREYHCHSLSYLDETGYFGCPRSSAHLDLHPATDIVTGEVCADDIQHVHWKWTEGYRFFVLIVPCTAQFPCLIPHFLHLRIEGVVLLNR